MDKANKNDSGIAFFWLAAFYFVNCARPGDLVHVFSLIPLAKLTAICALLMLFFRTGSTNRNFRDLPKESMYLLCLILLLFLSAVLSPIWKSGAFFSTLEFSKVYIAWLLTFFLVTNLTKLKRIMFIQAGSVAVVSLAALIKGHNVPRLQGVIGGSYGNSNDFAFAIVLSMPFCLAFLVSARSALRKAAWSVCILTMSATLVLTASRAGFIDLVISGGVCLWHLGIKGRRGYLIFGAILAAAALLAVAGGRLAYRFSAISDQNTSSEAGTSYEARKALIGKSFDAILEYPLLGIGTYNFPVYSGTWQEVHASYLQIAAEGGIFALTLYAGFFYRGFKNLRQVFAQHEDPELRVFAAALLSSLIGFVVGACFAPEAYQFFPYFTVCYTSVLARMPSGKLAPESVVVRYTSSGHRIVSTQTAPVPSKQAI